MQPTRVLQRNASSPPLEGQRGQTEHLNQDVNSGFNSNANMNQNFFIMEQKIQRIEVMLGAILQSVRPPNITGRTQ